MAKTRRPRRVVFVEWDDSAVHAKWCSFDYALDLEPMRCVTTGLLLSRDSAKVVVAGSFCDENDTVADVTTIPAGMVSKMTTLTTVRRRPQKGKR